MHRGWAVAGVCGILCAVGVGAQEGKSAPEEARKVVLPRPPFVYLSFSKKAAAAPALRLTKVSEKKNQITDVQEWFEENDLALPTIPNNLPQGDRGEIPADAPSTYAGQRLIRAIRDDRSLLLLYGPDFSGARYVALFDPERKAIRTVVDFGAYVKPPLTVRGEKEFVDEGVQWADVEDGVLYVSNFHHTYARSSRGHNGYLTAIDLESGKPLWRSRPLVANAGNFVLRGNAILTGYGFTAEPDFLYVLDRGNGAVVQTVKVRSAPEHLVLKGSRLYVRAYNTDYVFSVAP